MTRHHKNKVRSGGFPGRSLVNMLAFAFAQLLAVGGAWSIVTGGSFLRLFALGSVTVGLLLPVLYSLEAGMLAMVVFEPFRGILRRLQYLIVPYSEYEPIHLITPLITFVGLLVLLARQKLEIFYSTPLALPVTLLAAIYALQIFNPLQGGILVGLTGAMYYLVPVVWFYFGQNANEKTIGHIARMVVILGLLTSLYGVFQILYGYPEFELYWLENTDHYASVAVYNVTRAIATFSNAEEWGRYVQIGCLIAFGLCLSKSEEKKRVFWFGSGLFLILMLGLSGQRSSIFGLMLGLAVLFVTGAKSVASGMSRILIIAALSVGLALLPGGPVDDDIYALDESDGVSTILRHSEKGTLKPTGEGSLRVRLNTWSELITSDIPRKPLGAGLGARTIFSKRTSGYQKEAIDNHFLTVAIAAGVPAALLLIWILFRAFFHCFRMWSLAEPGSDQFVTYRIGMALVAAFILNNFFGTSFIIYSVAPLGWLLTGWISRRASLLPEEG